MIILNLFIKKLLINNNAIVGVTYFNPLTARKDEHFLTKTRTMKYYKVFVWNQGQPNYWIGKANSKEDAIKKSDRNPDDVYDVWLLDDWIENCEKRLGMYSKQKSE